MDQQVSNNEGEGHGHGDGDIGTPLSTLNRGQMLRLILALGTDTIQVKTYGTVIDSDNGSGKVWTEARCMKCMSEAQAPGHDDGSARSAMSQLVHTSSCTSPIRWVRGVPYKVETLFKPRIISPWDWGPEARGGVDVRGNPDPPDPPGHTNPA